MCHLDNRKVVSKRWLVAVVAIAATVLLGGAACVKTERVNGLIVDVQSEGVLELRSMELIDDDGTRWEFEGSGTFGHFSPSHLRQHMLAGERVEVAFRREAGRLIIVGLEDYP